MLPFMIGTAIVLGFGIAIYIHHQGNQSYCSDYGSRSPPRPPPRSGNCTNTKSQPSNQTKTYKVLICAICQDRIGSMVSTELKCGHSLHTECLGDLIKNQRKMCPCCQHDIEIRNNNKT